MDRQRQRRKATTRRRGALGFRRVKTEYQEKTE